MEDKIGVCVRTRPQSNSEKNQRQCVAIADDKSTLTINSKPDIKHFSFDYIADEASSQEEVFNNVGLPMAKTCLNGFNGTIICYGQTGTGKSHTIFGGGGSCSVDNEDRGIVPRVFEYLFIEHDKNPKTSLVAKCSFYEIYQEKVFDLLDVASTGSLQVREDSKLGVFVDGIVEEQVTSATAAFDVLSKGYNNRHVGETSMNRESSRSHVVFLLSLEVTEERENGVKVMKKSQFSLVDLAGSERQKDTHTSGERLKEASQINKSLSALGNVINALSTNDNGSSSSKDKQLKHVHYRDSKLTFLLRDSIGGNSKTVLIATITPAESQMAETLSTLKFAQRAKLIRNVVVCNEESTGTVVSLQKEILALKAKVTSLLGAGATASAIGCYGATTEYEEKMALLEKENLALNTKFDLSEKNLLGQKMTLKMRDGEVLRLKKKIEDVTDEFNRQTADAFARIGELTASVDHLSNELKDKDEDTKIRVISLEKSADEIREQLKEKEADFRASHDKATKDNTILVKTCRELELSIGQTIVALMAKKNDCETLQSELTRMSEATAAERASQNGIIDEMSADITRLSAVMLDLEQQTKDLSEYSRSLEKLNAGLKETMDIMTGDHSVTVAELDEAKKDLNSAMEEVAALMEGKIQLQVALDEANRVKAELAVETTKLSETNAEQRSLLEVSTIERHNLDEKIASLNEQISTMAQMESTLASDLEFVTKEKENYLSNYKRCAESLVVKQNELVTEEERGKKLSSEVDELRSKIAQQAEDICKLVEADGLAKDFIATCEVSMAELENELNDNRNELLRMTDALRTSETHLQDLQTTNATLAQENSNIMLRCDELQIAVTSLTASCQARDAALADKDAMIGKKEDIIGLNTKDIAQKDALIEKREADMAEMAAKTKEESEKSYSIILTMQSKLLEKDQRISELGCELDGVCAESRATTTKLQALRAEADETIAVVQKLQSKLSQKEDRIAALVDEIAVAADRNAKEQKTISGICRDLQDEVKSATLALHQSKDENAATAKHLADVEAQLADALQGIEEARQLGSRALEAEERVADAGRKMIKLEEAISEKDGQLLEMFDLKKALKKSCEKLVKLEGVDEKLKAAVRDLTKEAQASASLKVQLSVLEDSKKELQLQLQQAQVRSDKASQHVTEMQAENAKLCGHQNNKQKIQLHMQLKKDIEEQSALIKAQQDQIVQLTLERDSAYSDAKTANAAIALKRKNALAEENIAVDEDLVAKAAPVKRSKRILRDANAAADKENVY